MALARHQDAIIQYLKAHPAGADDELSAALGIRPRQQVNQICNRLAEKGLVARARTSLTGKLVNRLAASPPAPARPDMAKPATAMGTKATPITGCRPIVIQNASALEHFAYPDERKLTEDEVKQAVRDALREEGWLVEVKWGHEHGIDIQAQRDSERLILEAKGEGSLNAMRVNYFLGALGELLQRMDSADAQYGLALPAHRQFVGLVQRFPRWVRTRLQLSFYLVRPSDNGHLQVGVFPPIA